MPPRALRSTEDTPNPIHFSFPFLLIQQPVHQWLLFHAFASLQNASQTRCIHKPFAGDLPSCRNRKELFLFAALHNRPRLIDLQAFDDVQQRIVAHTVVFIRYQSSIDVALKDMRPTIQIDPNKWFLPNACHLCKFLRREILALFLTGQQLHAADIACIKALFDFFQ